MISSREELYTWSVWALIVLVLFGIICYDWHGHRTEQNTRLSIKFWGGFSCTLIYFIGLIFDEIFFQKELIFGKMKSEFGFSLFLILLLFFWYGFFRTIKEIKRKGTRSQEIKHSQEPSRTFKINQYLSLKLENGETNIYVKNKRFRQCKYLLFNIPEEDYSKYEEIESIDEAAKVYDHSHEHEEIVIPPEDEFWGHCSNLQAWAENNYDIRILHSSLRDPLLCALTDAGDPLARQTLKEMIAREIESDTIRYIIFSNKDFLDYLTEDEIKSLNISFVEHRFLLKYKRFLKKHY